MSDYTSKPRRRGRVDYFIIARRNRAAVSPCWYGIRHAKALAPGSKVVLVARVSTESQKDNGNLDDEVRKLLRWATRAGVEVVPVNGEKVYAYVGSSLHGWRLCPAVKVAKQAGAVIVTTTMDRYRRPEDFCAWADFYAPLTDHDMKELLRWADGVPLYTIADPDAPPEDNRSEQTKRGMEAKGHYGGRGKKLKRLDRELEKRERLLPEARRLRDEGLSYPAIGRLLGVSGKTVWKWLNGSKTALETVTSEPTAVKASPTPTEGGHPGRSGRENTGKTPSPSAVPVSVSTPPVAFTAPASDVTVSSPPDDPVSALPTYTRILPSGRRVYDPDDIPVRPTRGRNNGPG